MAANPPAHDLMKCATCSTSSNQKPLMTCSRCHTVTYWTKACQSRDWKAHKTQCEKPAEENHDPSPNHTSTPANYDPNAKPFTAIYDNKYPHNRPEEQTYRLLIDCLRLRQADVHRLEGVNMPGTIYAGLPSSEPAFRVFISKAKAKRIHPPWWTEASLEACVKFSRGSEHFGLVVAQNKAEIEKWWADDNLMTVKLSLLGAQIYGAGPGGGSGDAVLRLQMRWEQGDEADEAVEEEVLAAVLKGVTAVAWKSAG